MLFVETGENSLPLDLILLRRDSAFSMGLVQVQQFLSQWLCSWAVKFAQSGWMPVPSTTIMQFLESLVASVSIPNTPRPTTLGPALMRDC